MSSLDLSVLPLPIAVAVTCAMELGAVVDRVWRDARPPGWQIAVLVPGAAHAAQDVLASAGFHAQPHDGRSDWWWLSGEDLAGGHPQAYGPCPRCGIGRACVFVIASTRWICLACWRAQTTCDEGRRAMRCDEPGWELVSMHDPSGRRGIWFRCERDTDGRTVALEVCGGREGNDAYARIALDALIDAGTLYGVWDVLDRGAWMVREHRDYELEYARRKDDPGLAAIIAAQRDRDAAIAHAADTLAALVAERAELARLRAKYGDG